MTGRVGYVGVLAGCYAVGMVVGLQPFATRIDNSSYDSMSRNRPVTWAPQSVVVAVNEDTLRARGGMQHIRPILAEALDKIAEAKPKAVAVDVILADEVDPVDDARLEAALRANKNLILDCEVVGTKWEDPLPRFKDLAVALGHVLPEKDHLDNVSRQVALEQVADGQRRWALSLEAFRAANGAGVPEESPEDVTVGATLIPAPRDSGRLMWIRYLRAGTIPTVSALEIDQHRDLLRDKTVFLGITALTAAVDRLVNPYGENVSGVEVHAQAFETMAHGKFLTAPSSNLTVPLVCLGFTVAAGLIFGLFSGWPAYVLALISLAVAHLLPMQFFRHDIVFPYVAPVLTAWLSLAGAATYQHFFVRRQLRRTESEKSRYQQAMHWVAHEMRTPLTAIQGSSEIMSNYKLSDDKRQQLSEMINSESKRMAKMIQTFLDIERLGDGQVELKREVFNICDVAASCYKRAVPLAEHKQISVVLDTSMDANLVGDRELMEYALYNLLTNAIKYSAQETEIQISAQQKGKELRLSVRDQGMGMDAEEVKKVFTKFYRTKRAETSGEVGTGIGLSIVEEIVSRHGGRMEVDSEPGKGSCFTMVLKAELAANSNAKTPDRGR